jgi:hypothetical protein
MIFSFDQTVKFDYNSIFLCFQPCASTGGLMVETRGAGFVGTGVEAGF